MEFLFELGGFAEDETVVDGDYKAFNYCLAEQYASALCDEDFELVGRTSAYLIDNICYWINYNKTFGNEEIAEQIKNGTLITKNNRTLIDAIYANKAVDIAETYLLMGVYSPKLVLTIILSNEEDYQAHIGDEFYTQEKYTKCFKELYDLIEEVYEKQEDKKQFLLTIKNNYKRILIFKNYQSQPVPSTYNWVKSLKKIIINKE